MLKMKETIDWTMCIICKRNTTEDFGCHMKAKGTARVEPYIRFLSIVDEFHLLEDLPVDLKFGSTPFTPDDLIANCGLWHRPQSRAIGHSAPVNLKEQPIESVVL